MSFSDEVRTRISSYADKSLLKDAASHFLEISIQEKYSYNFSWLGRPIIQYPQDIIVMQELIWKVKPDLIIETGIAHGGSLIFSASMLALLNYADAMESKQPFTPSASRRKVVGVDIDIRAHNRIEIERHPLSGMLELIQGSSIAKETVEKIKGIASNYRNILIFLDSNHTHDHVLAELENYASLTSVGSYCVVFDTVIENLPDDTYSDRPWAPGNNPMTAVQAYLEKNQNFVIDHEIDNKLQISVAPQGYLRRVL